MKIKNELERLREIEEIKETILQRVADRMVKTNNTRPNHAVGEVYKPAALNTHDPHSQYQWADRNLPWWAWPLRLLGGLAFIAGIYSLVFLGMLL